MYIFIQVVTISVYIKCTYAHTQNIVGCYFTGTRTEVGEHKKDCSFKDESQLLAIAMKEVPSTQAFYFIFAAHM